MDPQHQEIDIDDIEEKAPEPEHQPLEQETKQQPQQEITDKKDFDHKEFGEYADSILQKENQLGAGITLHITENMTLGGTFSKHVVYHIEGEDKNGKIDVYRRFNEFYKMRLDMVKRFPGCFIPSIPEKSISIVDDQIANKRQRYLNDFVRKITKLPHLYTSQEFQALLRSQEKDLTSTFEKWPNPTTSDIINKYKEHFGGLAGKQINTQVRVKIHDFEVLICNTRNIMLQFKNMVKTLASNRDKFDKNLPFFFSKTLPTYEHQIMIDYVKDDSDLISINQSEAKFQEHEAVVRENLKHNPYWLLYDLIRHQERDGNAFLESIKAVQTYQNRKHEIQVKISQNSKSISEFMLAKKSNSEQKYKLQVENENLKKEKESVQCLTDIIIALVAFIQMERFRRQKTEFYENFLKKLGGYEINMVQNLVEIWKDWSKKTNDLLSKHGSA